MDKWEYTTADKTRLSEMGRNGWEAYAIVPQLYPSHNILCQTCYAMKRKIEE